MAYSRLNPPWYDSRYVILLQLQRALVGVIDAHFGGRAGLRLLDYGCGDCCYRPLFADIVAEYIGADLPGNPNAALMLGADSAIPAPDRSFDIVLSTQVLEHVEQVGAYLRECRRVLKSDGHLILSTHGLWMYHPNPLDLWRWTGPGLERELIRSGFDVITRTGLLGLAPAALQLLQDAVLQSRWVASLPVLIQAPFWIVVQRLIRLTDLMYSLTSRNLQASVHLMVARPSPSSS
jgi:SAM-dependent methyltransferase